MIKFSHIPVLKSEAIEALNVKAGKKYIDATLGGGSHTREIIEMGGIVLGIDKDEDSIQYVMEDQVKSIKAGILTLAQGNFRDIKSISAKNNFDNVDGILYDLGLSSYQLDQSGRGFSIRENEKLDMRMNKNQGLSAYEVVNDYPREKLEEIFYKYGEEHSAREIAVSIIEARKKSKIETTHDLAGLVKNIKARVSDTHPATKIFQAIRIEVNCELEDLEEGLKDGFDLVKPGGRMVVISFHSLEDRIVKKTFSNFSRQGKGKLVNKKPIKPANSEILQNRRSRSAKMRVFEKI